MHYFGSVTLVQITVVFRRDYINTVCFNVLMRFSCTYMYSVALKWNILLSETPGICRSIYVEHTIYCMDN